MTNQTHLPFNLPPDHHLERLLRLHTETPTDQDLAHEIVRIARRTMEPAEWFKLLFVDLCFDLGFVWPKMHGQDSIFCALTLWVEGKGTADIINGLHVQMISDNIPRHVGKVLDIAYPKMPWRHGKFTETEKRFMRMDSSYTIQQSGAAWELGKYVSERPTGAGKTELTVIDGIYYAPRVCDPPNPRDVLVMCRVPHPEGKTDLPDSPGAWGGSTSHQHFFMWGRSPFECTLPIDATDRQSTLPGMVNMMKDSAGSQYSVLKWCGYGFKARKFYKGIVTGQSKAEAAIKMLDQLDLAPNKLPPGSRPKRRRANR